VQTTSFKPCQIKDCDNLAPVRPVHDANPVPELKKVIGEVAICNPCQDEIDRINAKVRASIAARKARRTR
jgi:hypothetical protein